MKVRDRLLIQLPSSCDSIKSTIQALRRKRVNHWAIDDGIGMEDSENVVFSH